MPLTRGRQTAPSTEGASAGAVGGMLEQCANPECPSRATGRINTRLVEKYTAWGATAPHECQTYGYHLCVMCSTGYRTQSGLSQHLRRKHSELYHREEARRGTVKTRWTHGMLVRLAKEEIRLKDAGAR